jgi:hypothetical protein
MVKVIEACLDLVAVILIGSVVVVCVAIIADAISKTGGRNK